VKRRNGSKGELVMKTRKKHSSIVKMTYLAILTALIMVLHFTGIGIKLPFLGTPISLTLIPIALGGMLLGPSCGFFLGFVYGLVVYISYGVMGMDPMFTAILFANNPIMTFLICVIKTSVAGFLAGLLYNKLKSKNSILAAFIAAGITPVANTGLFILGCFLIYDTIAANFVAAGESVIFFIVIILPGINFIFEFIVNMIFSPAIHRIVEIVSKRLAK
jgi:LytS/YehU family sensor histidine kinase